MCSPDQPEHEVQSMHHACSMPYCHLHAPESSITAMRIMPVMNRIYAHIHTGACTVYLLYSYQERSAHQPDGRSTGPSNLFASFQFISPAYVKHAGINYLQPAWHKQTAYSSGDLLHLHIGRLALQSGPTHARPVYKTIAVTHTGPDKLQAQLVAAGLDLCKLSRHFAAAI